MKKKLLCAILAGTMILSVPVYAKDLSVTVPSYVTDAGLSDFPDSQESSTADDGSMVYEEKGTLIRTIVDQIVYDKESGKMYFDIIVS